MIRINREDMLELTRRMTLKRNCFSRIAGAYMDGEGYVDGTFNTHFQKLSAPEREANLAIAKAIPFSETNVNLKEYRFAPENEKAGSTWQLLMALRECELKNDALLDVFYEVIGERYRTVGDYAVYFFYGSYDVPIKASDKESLWEPKKSTNFLSVQSVRCTAITSRENRSADFCFPPLRTGVRIFMGLEVFDGGCIASAWGTGGENIILKALTGSILDA